MSEIKIKLPVKVSEHLCLRDAESRKICDTHSSNFEWEEDAVHLRHIAKCVNLHDGLVAALLVIPPIKLYALALFLDDYDKEKGLVGQTQMQDDVRKLAAAASAALSEVMGP
ncbi:MAG: hypothetical protein JWR19_2201 [Pedosphaera sp.]|nr:hypothetical protein [Pedosphaera sp.]